MIPKPYYILFATLDPLIALWGASLFLLSPSTVTSSYLPPPQSHDASKTHPASFSSSSEDKAFSLPLHAQIAGHLLSNALLSTLLLRAASNNLRVWRIYQLSLLAVDVLLLYGTFASYAAQGRLANPFATWRVEDWGAVAITGLAGLARASFLLGLGFPKTKTALTKSKHLNE